MFLKAFDLGITHFDAANNYGPPAGSAEETLGYVLQKELKPYRDELIISTKAGYGMWPGPYGDGGSKKFLLASLDQSLKRLQLDYVDIFYHHRPDNETPLEESMEALIQAVHSGKALYAGISNYPADKAAEASRILKNAGIKCLIHQPRYSMLDRRAEKELFPTLEAEGIGCITFSPLAQGLLTNKYLKGIPSDSRAGGSSNTLSEAEVTPELVKMLNKLNDVAESRGQSLAQMALAWILTHEAVTSVLIGTSKPSQVVDSVGAVSKLDFTDDELAEIDRILKGEK